MTTAVAATAPHSGSVAFPRPPASSRASGRAIHGVSSHSARMKKTSMRAASGHQSKPMSNTDHAVVASISAAKTCNAARRRLIKSQPVASAAMPATT